MRRSILIPFCIIAGVSSLNFRVITDPATGATLGTEDVLEGRDTRIEEPQKPFSISIQDTWIHKLGLKDWIPIQITSRLKSGPNTGDNLMPLCMPTKEGMDYKVNGNLTLSDATRFYDYEFFNRSIYLLTTSQELYCVNVNKEGNRSILVLKWVLKSLESLTQKQFGTTFRSAGMGFHKKTGLLYIPTDVGMFKVDVATQQISLLAAGAYKAPEGGEIVYTDVREHVLFVAYKYHGLFMYDIHAPDAVKLIGSLNASFFNRSTGDRFQISDFVVQPHLTEFDYYSTPGTEKPNPSDAPVFTSSSPPTTAWKDKDVLDFYSLFVAEKEAIYVVDISPVFAQGTLPDKPKPKRIEIADVKKLKRFQSSLYTVQTTKLSNGNFRSYVYEVFLQTPVSSIWNYPETPLKDLYSLNRLTVLNSEMNNIFADDQFYYILGDNLHYVFPRGVSKDQIHLVGNIGTTIYEPNIFGLVTLHTGEYPTLLAFSPQSVMDVSIELTDPVIRCKYGDYPAGKYIIEMNATTRECPTKNFMKLNLSSRHNQICRWSKTVEVEIENPSVVPKSSSSRWAMVLLAISVLALLSCLGVLYTRYRDAQNQYAKLKREIGTLKPTDENQFYRQSSTGEGQKTIEMAEGDVGSPSQVRALEKQTSEEGVKYTETI